MRGARLGVAEHLLALARRPQRRVALVQPHHDGGAAHTVALLRQQRLHLVLGQRRELLVQ